MDTNIKVYTCFCTFNVQKVNCQTSFQLRLKSFKNIQTSLCLHHSRSMLMEAQILRAGPSLMFMVEMR